MNLGSRKNHILEPQKQTADEVQRYLRVRGKEHRMGEIMHALNLKRELQHEDRRVQIYGCVIRGSTRDALPLGGGGICFVRTAALQGGFEKQKVNASMDCWQQPVHHAQESFEKQRLTVRRAL